MRTRQTQRRSSPKVTRQVSGGGGPWAKLSPGRHCASRPGALGRSLTNPPTQIRLPGLRPRHRQGLSTSAWPCGCPGVSPSSVPEKPRPSLLPRCACGVTQRSGWAGTGRTQQAMQNRVLSGVEAQPRTLFQDLVLWAPPRPAKESAPTPPAEGPEGSTRSRPSQTCAGPF